MRWPLLVADPREIPNSISGSGWRELRRVAWYEKRKGRRIRNKKKRERRKERKERTKERKEEKVEFSSSWGLWFCLSDTKRKVMAHFVKLIGSLELDGTGLVPLNFSFDYTTKTLSLFLFPFLTDLFRTRGTLQPPGKTTPVNYRRGTMTMRSINDRSHLPLKC